MTVSYAQIISSSQGGVFIRLLLLWKGSLYKLVWPDLLVYLILYYILNFSYRFALNEPQKRNFEQVVMYCDDMKNNIPISFLLGFFVAGVISRWWTTYMTIPWLNRFAFRSQGIIVGQEKENARRIRQTLIRYCNLSWILLMRTISDQISHRLNGKNPNPSIDEIMKAINNDIKVRIYYKKMVLDEEIEALKSFEEEYKRTHTLTDEPAQPQYWVPLQWCVRLVKKAYVHGYVSDPRTMAALINEVDMIRSGMKELYLASRLMIPLVYTQVVIIAVYSYFLCHLFSMQFVDPKQKIKSHEIDFYVPLFTIFQFLFLMGWLKVAMCVMNPFGDDDEDFRTSYMMDYNLEITYNIATAADHIYPSNLNFDKFTYKPLDTARDDQLHDFLNKAYDELNDVPEVTTHEIRKAAANDGGESNCDDCACCLFAVLERSDSAQINTSLARAVKENQQEENELLERPSEVSLTHNGKRNEEMV